VLAWIGSIVGKKLKKADGIQECLKTGVEILELLNKLSPGSVDSINRKDMPFAHRENISKYIDTCKAMGMNKADLFDAQDLYDGKNIVSVIEHFHRLSKGLLKSLPADAKEVSSSSASAVKKTIDTGLSLQTSGSYGVDAGPKGTALRRDVVRDATKAAVYADHAPTGDDEPLSELDRDIKKKMDAKYDPAKEKEIREWIEAVLKKKLSGDSLQEALKSGIVVCQLLNKIWPGSIPEDKISPKEMAFFQRVNISTYLDACKARKMNLVDLFDTQDLYDNKNMAQVINHFYSLSGFARINSKFAGPFVGIKYSEKKERDFSEEVLAAGKFMPSAQTTGSYGVLEPESEPKLAYQIIKDVDHIKKTKDAAKKKAEDLYG